MDVSALRSRHFLAVDGRAVAAIEVAATSGARRRGLLGRHELCGAFLLPHTASVHTFTMRFPLDVAFCNRNLQVVAVRMMVPARIALPRIGVRAVVEARHGMFTTWELRPGSQLTIVEQPAAPTQ